ASTTQAGNRSISGAPGSFIKATRPGRRVSGVTGTIERVVDHDVDVVRRPTVEIRAAQIAMAVHGTARGSSEFVARLAARRAARLRNQKNEQLSETSHPLRNSWIPANGPCQALL
ncbi:hypothetical protein, partial [Streptomyces sp. NPDC088178]|uniref:hypothetical protein n=1 Tax=Streptomyces sp. NPDC088178 TaxID=3365836 RepID=UPI003803463C